MKKYLILILTMMIVLSSTSIANASIKSVPTNLCESIGGFNTSAEEIMRENTFVQVLMACCVMVDYCAYNPLYMPSYENPSYIGLVDNVNSLYFAIPDTKGQFHLLLYSPDKSMLFYMGDDTIQSSKKDAEYVMETSCKKYVKLDSEDMLAGANYIINLFGK